MTYSHREFAPPVQVPFQPDEHAAGLLALPLYHPTRLPTYPKHPERAHGSYSLLAAETLILVQEVWHLSGRLFCICPVGSLAKDQFGHAKAPDTITESWHSCADGIHCYERTRTSHSDVRVLQ